MNRVIKFRAWDDKKKEYTESYMCEANEGLETDIVLNGYSEEKVIFIDTYNHIILEPFTGLTDRHGKEIFEGDILTNGNFIYYDTCECDTRKHVIRRSKRNASYYYCIPTKNIKIYDDGYIYRIPLYEGTLDLSEIVGNIHENGELLK